MTIAVNMFTGEKPRVGENLLPDEAAAVAEGCLYDSGHLEGIPQRTAIAAALVADPRSIFFYEGAHWFSWLADVSVIESPIAQDAYARVYFTGDGAPKVTSNLIATGSDPKPAASYRLGVPAPDAPIAVISSGGGDDDDSTDESRAYVFTYVTEYGEEGPPSAASNIVVLDDPTTNTVDLTLPTLSTNPYNITQKRIYRTVTTGSDTSFYLVAEIPLAQTAYNDAILSVDLGPAVATDGYDLPPDDMSGLVMGSNGMAAGFAGNEFMVSEPYLPYAFPLAYRRSTVHDIVAIAATATGFVLATTGFPYVVSGVRPDAMSEIKIDLMQACVSARSMVDMGDFVLYASPDGLVRVSESGAGVMTETIIKKRDWAQFHPETIRAYRYENKYIAFFNDGQGDSGGFVFEPESMTITRLGYYASAGYNDLETDELYLVIDGALYQWATGTQVDAYRWRSKVFHRPDMAYGAAKVWTKDPANVGFKLFVDDAEVMSVDALTNETFRLPDVRGCRWQFELFGTGTVERVSIAGSFGDLQ
ncbi:MAG: hypothetical protein AAGI44_02320 [Pseudomonadota bacterium]